MALKHRGGSVQETRELLRNTCCCFLSGQGVIWREQEGKNSSESQRGKESFLVGYDGWEGFWAEGQILSSGPNKKPPTWAQRQICNCFQQGWRREGGEGEGVLSWKGSRIPSMTSISCRLTAGGAEARHPRGKSRKRSNTLIHLRKKKKRERAN